MYKIEFRNSAKLDYFSIFNYISENNLFYANKVLLNINNSIEILKTFPLIGKELDVYHRQIVEPKYKFKIVYKVENDIIYIIAIFREQENWK